MDNGDELKVNRCRICGEVIDTNEGICDNCKASIVSSEAVSPTLDDFF